MQFNDIVALLQVVTALTGTESILVYMRGQNIDLIHSEEGPLSVCFDRIINILQKNNIYFDDGCITAIPAAWKDGGNTVVLLDTPGIEIVPIDQIEFFGWC